MKLVPVPVAGLPPGADQENVNGEVPPDAVAVNVTAVPVVPVEGPLMLTASASPPQTIVAEAGAVLPLLSVAVTVTVNVPLTEQLVVKLDPVPVAGLIPGALQLNVYGAVPPVAVAVKVTGVPTVPVVGPLTLAVRVRGVTVMVTVLETWLLWVGVAESVTVSEMLKLPLAL